MAKYIILLVFVFLGATSSKLIKPRDLVDEVGAQLEELQTIVQGDILAAHDNLQNLEDDFKAYSNNSFQSGSIKMQQENEAIYRQLDTVKELGNSADVNISSCTYPREDDIGYILKTYTQQLGYCVDRIDAEVLRVTVNARYIVDISINKVQALRFQLVQCREDFLCISPIMSEVQLDKIRLPQNIQTEVLATGSILTTLKVSIEDCVDHNMDQYISKANSVLSYITACVEALLS